MKENTTTYEELVYRTNAAAVLADTIIDRPAKLHPYNIIQLANAIKLTLAQTDHEGVALLPGNTDTNIDAETVLATTNEFIGYDSPLIDGNIFLGGMNCYVVRRPTNGGITSVSCYSRSKVLKNIPYINGIANTHIRYMEEYQSDAAYINQLKAKKTIRFQKDTNFWHVSKYMMNNAQSLEKAKSARDIAQRSKTPNSEGNYDGRTIAQLLGNSGAMCTQDTILGSNDQSLRYYMRSYTELEGLKPINRSFGTTLTNSFLGIFGLELYKRYQMSTGKLIPKSCVHCPLKTQCNQLYTNLTNKTDSNSALEIAEFYNNLFDKIDTDKTAFIIL
jgi:hypothetical protein